MLRKIAWKNIVYKPLNTALCISLLMFGVAIISVLLLLQHQVEQKLDQDLKNIDLVVGAKGSPLQLVLSAIYHLDSPTGNIKLADAEKIMQHPMVAEAIPLAYGDSYKGYRILGTSSAYAQKYEAELAAGRFFSKPMEVSLGADIAKKTGLKVGDHFLGTHGDSKHGHVHENQPYTVVGILEASNSVLDRLILTDIESVWQVHQHQEDNHAHEKEKHEHHEHEHNHEHEHEHQTTKREEAEITAILLKYKNKLAVLNMPRMINDQTSMQAVLPALEINRLFYMLGIGTTSLKLIAAGIILMAGFSLFFVLYSRLQDRKYELALMRSVGYRPSQLFLLLVLEGLLLTSLGAALGYLISRGGIYLINQQAASSFNIQFESAWIAEESILLVLTFIVGFIAALLPAWQAMRMNVSTILSEK